MPQRYEPFRVSDVMPYVQLWGEGRRQKQEDLYTKQLRDMQMKQMILNLQQAQQPQKLGMSPEGDYVIVQDANGQIRSVPTGLPQFNIGNAISQASQSIPQPYVAQPEYSRTPPMGISPIMTDTTPQQIAQAPTRPVNESEFLEGLLKQKTPLATAKTLTEARFPKEETKKPNTITQVKWDSYIKDLDKINDLRPKISPDELKNLYFYLVNKYPEIPSGQIRQKLYAPTEKGGTPFGYIWGE